MQHWKCAWARSGFEAIDRKIGHGFSRLAFWRKPAALNPEPPAPEVVRHSETVEAQSSTATDDPARQDGWLARLKQTLRRNRKPDPEAPREPEIAAVAERPSKKTIEAGATADNALPTKPSLLARLKSTLHRQPAVEKLEADEDRSKLRPEKTRGMTAPSHADADGDEDAIPAGRFRRVFAVLSSKRVWIPGISVLLIAIIATMAGMLLQSGQEKKQLQIELLAAQQKLKQPNTVKKAAPGLGAVHAAASSRAVATASESPAQSASGAGSGDCEISNPKNVAENLKNCINSFNAMAQ